MPNISKDYSEMNIFRLRSGTCKVQENEKLTLTVGTRELDAINITQEDITWLEQQLEVAYYSKDNVKTTDVSVRNSKFTKAFHLNFDINSIIKEIGIEEGYTKPYKLNLYKSGSFFANHRDTNRSGLLGTLILILPTEYSGGELVFEGFNMDKYQLKHDRVDDRSLRFIYFATDLEHSVTEVLTGYRISLVYNVFSNEKSAGNCKPIVALSAIPEDWYQELLEYAYSFCENKKNILFGCLKYRNDVSNKVIDALEERFPIIRVGVKEIIGEDLTEIKEVHELDDEGISADDSDYEFFSSDDFEEHAVISYKVEHVLFPKLSVLKEKAQYYSHGGNSPCSEHGKLVFLSGFLINPSK